MIRFLRQTAWLPLVFLIAPVFVNAEVSRVDITSRRDVAGEQSFGSVGPYSG